MVIDQMMEERIKETFSACYESLQQAKALKEGNKDTLGTLAESLGAKKRSVNKAFKDYCDDKDGKEKEGDEDTIAVQVYLAAVGGEQ